MEFRTGIDIVPSEKKITYKTPVLLAGSCFAEEIGRQFTRGKMPTLINPFGILYNPASTAKALDEILENKVYTEEDLHFFNNKYLSFNHDTEFSSPEIEKCLGGINASVEKGRSFLRNTSCLFITFGTAWVYRWNIDNRIVANCHKIPAREFTRFLLKPAEITAIYDKLITKLRDFNNDLKIIFTLSPVRHLKDGAHGNQVSKSTLLLAIEDLMANNKNLSYFPSYEIMLDELRDYRFYKKDMVHPSETAVEYIWKKLKETYFEPEAVSTYDRLIKIAEAKEHRITEIDSPGVEAFKKSILRKIEGIMKDHPEIDLNSEKEYFENLGTG